MLASIKRHMGHDLFLRGLMSLGVCVTAIVAQAQLVFIPDVQFRAWLNMALPDAMDADGYLDTANPYIPLLTHCAISVDWDPVDLTGLEYLSSIDTLSIYFEDVPHTVVAINALPPTLRHLTLNSFPGADLPPFPSTLKSLDLYAANSITSIQSLPPDLEYFSIYAASALTSIAPMPTSMHVVGLGNLTSLADLSGVLPDTITGTLNLEALPQLTVLPPLPHFAEDDTLVLTNLALVDALPQFPDHVAYLQVHTLPLVTSMPAFPADLKELYLFNLDNLNILPSFPAGTPFLLLSGLPLVSALPYLPDSLSYLHVQYMPLLECLPAVPPSTSILNVFNSGVDCVSNIPSGMNTNLPLCGFYNAGSCPFFAPSVSGRVYHDLNANGVRDAGEPGVGYATVDVAPGNTITGVANNGFYAQALDSGTYTITPHVNNAYVTSISPATHSAMLVDVSDLDSLNDFGVLLQANVQDLVVNLTQMFAARPGFNNTLQLTYSNQGTIDMSGTVTCNFDEDQTWNSSSPQPDMLAGNTATWNFANLIIGEQRQINISLHTDPAVLLGTPIIHTAVADPVISDGAPANNMDNITSQVVGSFDPNNKTVSPSEMSSSQVASGERLSYTIRFQNTGTYLADRVIITDTLSTGLQWNTMDLVASSHPCTWFIHDGTLRFTFDTIDLPDSTSNEPMSHGFVAFSMEPNATLTNGMQVGNTANIYFDFNAPVITNEALFSVSDPQGIASAAKAGPVLSPNPVHDILRVGSLSGSRSALTVLDATGRRVSTTLVTGPSGLLDVSTLLPGAYQLRLEEDGAVRHFVKY
jgi:uncharacterized repeat protein (TIGR01451 family)